MAHAIMMLSDQGGAIAMHMSWEGEFDKESPAHQHMLLLKQALDKIANALPEGEPLPTAIAVARLAASIEAKERQALEDGTAEPMFGSREPVRQPAASASGPVANLPGSADLTLDQARQLDNAMDDA